MYTIYYHKSPEKKYYIGQTCQKLEDRWKNGNGYKSSPKFFNAIQKYGWNNFEHGILEDNLTSLEADEKEAYYIQLFDSVNNGYNTYLQNYSNYHFHDLWVNQETRQRIIEKLKQQRNTIEYKQQQSNMMKNKWQDDGYRKKQQLSWTEERKNNVSNKSKKLWNNKLYREKFTESARQARLRDWQNPEYRKKICKQVYCVETQQIFESVKDAAKFAGVKSNTLSMALRSKTHQSGKHPVSGEKLHWYYYSDIDGRRDESL